LAMLASGMNAVVILCLTHGLWQNG